MRDARRRYPAPRYNVPPMVEPPSAPFPKLLRRAWGLTDPASRRQRTCDALDEPTPHQLLQTIRGGYWICGQTGQFTRHVTPADDQVLTHERRQRIVTYSKTGRQVRQYERRLQRLARYRRTGRLFEVGTGGGLFLRAAVDAGWSAAGIDAGKDVAAHAAEVSGADVAHSTAEQLELETGAYDVIVCNNVFEHLAQPRQVLEKLSNALHDGGVIYLQTLCAQSLSLWFQPTGWLYYGAGHLIVPTLVSMRHYFAHAGLTPIHFESHGFRSTPAAEARSARRTRRRTDKAIAMVAGRVRRGHRVTYLLRKG